MICLFKSGEHKFSLALQIALELAILWLPHYFTNVNSKRCNRMASAVNFICKLIFNLSYISFLCYHIGIKNTCSSSHCSVYKKQNVLPYMNIHICTWIYLQIYTSLHDLSKIRNIYIYIYSVVCIKMPVTISWIKVFITECSYPVSFLYLEELNDNKIVYCSSELLFFSAKSVNRFIQFNLALVK